MQCGLDSGPSVTDGCWWVVRVVVEVFDELSGVVTRSPCGPEINGARLMRGYLSNFLFSSRLGHVAWASAGSGHEADVEEKGVTIAVSI